MFATKFSMEKRIKIIWIAEFFLPVINATVFSGPNNGVGWIFCSPFIGKNKVLWKNFKILKKRIWTYKDHYARVRKLLSSAVP